MPNSLRSLKKLTVPLLLASLAAACTGEVSPAPTVVEAATPAAAATPPDEVESPAPLPRPQGPPCPAPLRVGVLLDKSRSVYENVIPQMTPEELEGLIGLVDTCAGGEIAVGVLCNVSGDKPFARLFLADRVSASGAPAKAPTAARDPFTELLLAQAAADAATERSNAEKSDALARAGKVDRFRKEALELVHAPVSCTRTDVIAGANRLLMYLDEPLPPRTVASPTRVAVFITDGKDTVRRQTLRRSSDLDAVFLLVGGSPDAGALTPLNPARFESVTSAFRWLQSASAAR